MLHLWKNSGVRLLVASKATALAVLAELDKLALVI